MRKCCKKCEAIENLEMAHMISYTLAKIIVIRQLGVPKCDRDWDIVKGMIHKVRKNQGDIPLCKKCHIKSNEEQKNMVAILMKGFYK